jgi:hypothetical protein
MSKKSLIQQIQPVALGPVYGRVSNPVDFMNSQIYAHKHIEGVVRDALMADAANALVAGFNYTLPGGLNVSIAAGQAIAPNGLSHDTLPLGEARVIALNAAHPALPRIDLIYALLETDADAGIEFRPYVRLRTQIELEAGVPPYSPSQFNQPTEQHTRATIYVRAGEPNAAPVAPVANANEVPLYTVRVDAAAIALAANKVTDARNKIRSLFNAHAAIDLINNNLNESIDDRVAALMVDSTYFTKVYNDAGNLLTLDADLVMFDARYVQNVNLNESVDDRVAALMVDSTYFTKVYDDNGNLLTLDADLAMFDARYVNQTGDTMTGALNLSPAAGTLAAGGSLTALTIGSGATFQTNYPILQISGVDTSGAGQRAGMRLSFYSDYVGNNCTSTYDWGTPDSGSRGLWKGHNGYTSYCNSTVFGGIGTAFVFRSVSLATFGQGDKIVAVQNASGAEMFSVGQNGNVTVAGSLSKASGTFQIDHPLDPTNKDLYHGFVESSEYMLLYRVSATLKNGKATVKMDESCRMTNGTFAALVQDAEVVSVLSRGAARVTAGDITNGSFKLVSESADDGSKVICVVMGARQDAFIKTVHNVDESGRLVPEQNKPGLTKSDLAEFETRTEVVKVKKDEDGMKVIDPETTAPTIGEETEIVGTMFGKKGFPRHIELYEIKPPTRIVNRISQEDFDAAQAAEAKENSEKPSDETDTK